MLWLLISNTTIYCAAAAIPAAAQPVVRYIISGVSGCTPSPLPPVVPEKRGGSQATAHALRHTAF